MVNTALVGAGYWGSKLQSTLEKIKTCKVVQVIDIKQNQTLDDLQEKVLNEANEDNFELMNRFLLVLKTPFEHKKNTAHFQSPPPVDTKHITFCGT